MGALDGFEPVDFRVNEARSRWHPAEIVKEFLDANVPCMGKSFDNDSELFGMINSLRQYLQRKPNRDLGVRVSKKGRLILLYNDNLIGGAGDEISGQD